MSVAEQPKDDAEHDAALARRIGRGDVAAEAELCARLSPRLVAFALRRLRDEAAARDVAQQTLVIALERLRGGTIAETERLGGFLLGIAKHVILGARRGERRRRALLDRYGYTTEGETGFDETVVDRRRLGECFHKLPARAQTILALTFFADREAEEIAHELGTTSGNVRVLRHRALAQLNGCMEAT
jgi:RNA polymerase sigma-70 factor, ECF subfamily